MLVGGEILDWFKLHLRQLARLSADDMNAVTNMKLLAGGADTKKSSTGAFSLKFDIHKVCICCQNYINQDNMPLAWLLTIVVV